MSPFISAGGQNVTQVQPIRVVIKRGRGYKSIDDLIPDVDPDMNPVPSAELGFVVCSCCRLPLNLYLIQHE